MTTQDLVRVYLLENRMSKKNFAKKVGTSIQTLTRFLNGEDVFNKTFVKIIKGVDYEIHLKPRNTSTPTNGSGASQPKTESVPQNK